MKDRGKGSRTPTPPKVGVRADPFPMVYVLVYAAVALGISWRTHIGDLDLESDFYGDLVLAAQALVRGQFSVTDYPYKGPLYSFVLAAVHVFVSDWYRAAVVTSVLAAAAALVAVHRVVGRVFGPKVALGTLIATSLVPDFFLYSHRATTDVLFFALATASLTLYCSHAAPWRSRGVAGALAGLAFLTRYNGLVLLAAAVAADLVVARGGRGRGERWRAAAWFTIAFLLVASPWFGANLHATGRLLPDRNAQNVAAGLYGDARWSQVHASDAGDLLALLRESPGRAPRQFCRNLVEHAGLDLQRLLGWPLALLPILGAIGLLIRPATPEMRRFLCFPVAHFLAMGMIFYSPRFSFFLVPAYLATGFSFLLGAPARPGARWTARLGRMPDLVTGRRARFAWAVVLAGCAAFHLSRIVAIETEVHARQPLALFPASQALRAHAAKRGGAAPRVMARKGQLAFLAALPYQPYPKSAARSLDSLVAFARERGVRYIAYGGPEFALCPELRFLATADSIPGLDMCYATPGLRVFSMRDTPSLTVISDTERLAMLMENVRIADKRGVPDVQVRALGDLATFQLEHGEPFEAEATMRRIIAVCEAATSRRDVAQRNAAIARYKLARVLLETGRADEAAKLADASSAYFERNGPPSTAAQACLLAARCYEALGAAAESAARTARAHQLDPRVAPESR